MNLFFNYLIFPGAFFSLFVGGLGWWLERKLTARFQYRLGPPWYQNFIDVAKLFLKETVIPQQAFKSLFILSPMLTFSSVLAFSVIAACAYFTRQNIIGDIVVMIYLLIIPTLFIVLGAFSSGNPLGLVGAAREIKLMLAYELVFIMSVIIVLIKAHGSLLLVDVLNKQVEQSSYIASASGFIAFVLALIYFQAKLGIVPFDVAEAEQEIMAGTAIEYSGPLLGFYRLSRLFLYFSLPLFIITLLWPGKPLSFIYKYVLFILLVSVIKNVNPRLRIKDALIFFWFWLFTLGIVGIILAIKGF